MLVRAHPATPDDLVRLTRPQLIDQILASNDGATFKFSQKWLQKQRTKLLRELLSDRQEQLVDNVEA